LGIVQSVSVVPLWSFSALPVAADFLEPLLSLSSPPHATTAVGTSTRAIADATTASLVGTSYSSSGKWNKNVFVTVEKKRPERSGLEDTS
jgi:hypothetical protein